MAIFTHSTDPIQRRHGPGGYATYRAFKDWLRDEFAFRCAYCLFRERWYPSGADAFSADHVVAQAVDATRTDDYENLVYACLRCNSLKQDTRLPDPTRQGFGDLLRVRGNGFVVPSGAEGRLLVGVLELNDAETVRWRKAMIDHGRDLTSRALIRNGFTDRFRYFAYPDDLPNLRRFRPPTNSRPLGVQNCYFLRRRAGTLAATY